MRGHGFTTNRQVRTSIYIPPATHRIALERFYTRVAPSKMEEIDAILAHYSGKEEEMYLVIENTYNRRVQRPVGDDDSGGGGGGGGGASRSRSQSSPPPVSPRMTAAAAPKNAGAAAAPLDGRVDLAVAERPAAGGLTGIGGVVAGNVDVHKRGWMEKRGEGMFSVYQPRWFELHVDDKKNAPSLVYFARLAARGGHGADRKGAIPLAKITAVLPGSRRTGNNCFNVDVPGRRYELKCKECADVADWIASINAACRVSSTPES